MPAAGSRVVASGSRVVRCDADVSNLGIRSRQRTCGPGGPCAAPAGISLIKESIKG